MATPQELQSRYGVHLLAGELPQSMKAEAIFGLVHGTSIMGANFVKDFFARVADVTGGRVGGYEKAVRGAVDRALEEMVSKAAKLGANAIVNVRIVTSAVHGTIMMATVSGTAVYAEETPDPDSHSKEPFKYLNPEPLG